MSEGEPLPKRKWLRHEIPPQIPDHDPRFFLTICCQKRGQNQLASDRTWTLLKESVLRRNQSGIWQCTLFLAMPDHIHGIFHFSGDPPMKKAVADWKRWTATHLSLKWQKGFFDHRLRDEASAVEKRNYILKNPVRANLVSATESWPFFYDHFRTNGAR